jgi:hypothetical protein
MVCAILEHVLHRLGYGSKASNAIHQGDLTLLLMANRMRHQPQTEIAASPQFFVSHRHGTCVMERHELNKYCVEGMSFSYLQPADLLGAQKAGHLSALRR